MLDFAQELHLWSEKSCRLHLESCDIHFIQSTLRTKFKPKLIESLLTEDKLFYTILESTEQLPISPQLYFYVLLQRTFLKTNINNIFLLDYLVFILTTNLRTKNLNQELYISDYLNKINLANDNDKFYLRIELSNQILFLTGLFQDYIQHRVERGAAPSISFYEGIGSIQYNAAINHPLANQLHLKDVFIQLSHEFTNVRQTLNQFSENLLSLGESFSKQWLI